MDEWPEQRTGGCAARISGILRPFLDTDIHSDVLGSWPYRGPAASLEVNH